VGDCDDREGCVSVEQYRCQAMLGLQLVYATVLAARSNGEVRRGICFQC